MTALSAAEDLFRFDLEAGPPFEPARATRTFTAAGGPANGVVRWLRLQLDEQGVYENDPSRGNTSHWSMQFTPFADGRTVAAGEAVTVGAAHDGLRVYVWIEPAPAA